LLLYVAAREGRLVWRGPESLALLQPPGDMPRPAPDRRTALARSLVREWDTLILAVPPASMLTVAALSGLVWATTGGGVVFGWVLIVLVLGALLHVTVLLTCGVLSGLCWFIRQLGRPAPERVAAGLLPGEHWSMVLCHHVQPASPPRLLLREVRRRLDELLESDAAEAAADRGVRMTRGQVTEELVCPRGGVTTEDMRAEVDEWSERVADGLTVRLSDHRAIRKPIRIFDRGGFLLWYLTGEAVAVLVLAQFVSGWERAACGDACAGHPVTYGLAVRWLAQRLLFTDPYGLSPAGWPTWAIGWLVSVMSATGVLVLLATLRQHVRVRRIERNRAEERVRRLGDRSRTLIMVATAVERDAVIAAVRAVNGVEPEPLHLPHQTVLRLGTVSRTRLMLAHVEPGTVRPGSAATAAAALIDRLDLDFLIVAGICYGLDPGNQEYGDILVCDQLRAVGHRKETDPAGPRPAPPRSGREAADRIESTPPPGGERVVLVRGDYVTPSTTLLHRLHEVERTWQRPPEVHFGPMLSTSVLVNSRSLRDELRGQQPEAIGGEMEGAGVYAAAAEAKVDWIIVKAISDWGFDKQDEYRAVAAGNAAAFVILAAREGALDDPPGAAR
jgi:nucleoside phosphorylase